MSCFDIRPFALPNTPPNEIRFEDPRDIGRIVVAYPGAAPDSLTVSYLRKVWPKSRVETLDPAAHSHSTGWIGIDDWFNTKWHEAAVSIERVRNNTVSITFAGLKTEFDDMADYDVTFRRTLGVKIEAANQAVPEKVEVYTTSVCADTVLRVALDAGGQTVTKKVEVTGYNADVKPGFTASEPAPRAFDLQARHMVPTHPYCYDEGLVTFRLDNDTFTISLESLAKQGPIWFEEEGVFITLADDPVTFEQYRSRSAAVKSTYDRVLERPEQTLGGAMNGQPRPHPCACTVGCKHARQRFWLDPVGDIITHKMNLDLIKGRDTERFANEGNGRLFFDLGRWCLAGRYFDPAPVLAYNQRLVRDDILLERRTLAVPLERSIFDDILGDDTIICLSRFRFTNTGDGPMIAELPISYSEKSHRMHNRLEGGGMDDCLVPLSPRQELSLSDLGTDSSGVPLKGMYGDFQGKSVLRCAVASDMPISARGEKVTLRKELAPGEACEAVVKMPYIALDQPGELAALAAIDFESSYADVRKFWREECATGAQIHTGEPNLDALYKAHLAHIEVTDSRMCDDPDLINTSVGSSTYGNFTNESVMIVEELDERGLAEQARQRIDVWLKYQGTKGLVGLFTDHDGVFYGAGGYEMGDSYDQHHGWVLWYIAKHYEFTGDKQWLLSVAGKLIEGVDWVVRQRKETASDMPHSRGWEKGFLAAGGLEDVDDFFYWLSTNSLTWRGMEYAARALEAIGHAEAARVRAEADDYRQSLVRGFETNRQHSPLVRLRDGRWIPHYPSRLYRRGRDIGWIREVLECSIYLLISGLYDPNSKQGRWILEDCLDNRYMHPYYSYPVYDPERNWVDFGGFSNQPNLLAGLMPHLDRDEPEHYIWMFFNAWAACYREEVSAMVEHPQPILGFSNSAIFKTSDQANAVKWLRYMFVYANDDLLHLGRAIPRDWFRDGNTPYANDVITRYGKAGVRYESNVASGTITAKVDLALREAPGKVLVRFRHPEKLPIASVTVNGAVHSAFDAVKGDVDITGLAGSVEIVANY